MRVAIEGIVSVFFIALLVWVSVGLINAQIDINQAQDFQSNAVINLHNSNFDDGYIEEYTKLAEDLGYTLDVQIVRLDKIRCHTCNCNQIQHCMIYPIADEANSTPTLVLNGKEYKTDGLWRSYDASNTFIQGSMVSDSYSHCPDCGSQILRYSSTYVGRVALTYNIKIANLGINETATKVTSF